MSRVLKKALSLTGLAFVVGITAIASGIPPVASEEAIAQSSNVQINFEIKGAELSTTIVDPAEASTLYDGNTNSAIISYSGEGTFVVSLIRPGESAPGIEIDRFTNGPNSNGTRNVDLRAYLNDGGYGDYTLSVDAYNTQGGLVAGDATDFSYHAITADPKPDNKNGAIRVHLGPSTCKITASVYGIDDILLEDLLLEHTFNNLTAYPTYPQGYIDIEIPGFIELDSYQEYNIVITSYANCTSDGGGDELEEVEVDLPGSNFGNTPPDTGDPDTPGTGALSILGISIASTDYLITGLIVFAIVIAFAFILLNKRKKTKLR